MPLVDLPADAELDAAPGSKLVDLPSEATLDRPQQPGPLGMAAKVAGGFAQDLSAAMQGTSPIVRGLNGGANYQSLGPLINSDAGPAYADPTGAWKMVDPTQHVVLTDPTTGKPTVYLRSPSTNESRLTSLGRFLGFGAAMAPSDIAAPTLTAPVTQTITNRFGGEDTQALTRIGKALRADAQAGGPTPGDIAQGIGGETTALDVGGENVRGLAGQVARVPGPGRQQLVDALNARDATAPERLAQAVTDAGGSGDSTFLTSNALQQQARQAAAPLYEKAFEPGSVAPLEKQFEGALSAAGKERADAFNQLAAAQQQATLAQAKKTLAGDNVYLNSSALSGERDSAAALQAAQQRFAQANTAAETIRGKLQAAQAAAAAGQRGGVWSPRLQQFLDDPIFQSGLKNGLEIQRLEALAEGKPFNPADYAITGMSPTGEPIVGAVPNMRTLDAGKRGLDNMLESYRDATTGRLVLDQRGNAINQVRQAFLKEIDGLNPDYAAARAAYSGPQQSRGALLQGAQALNRNPDQIGAILNGLSPGDQQFYRLGAANALKTVLAKTSSGGNEAKAIIGNAYRQQQLRAIFPNADQLINAAQTEGKMFDTRQSILGGSQTAARLAQDAGEGGNGFLQPLGEAFVAGATHEPVMAAKAGVSALRKLFGVQQMTPQVAARIAGYLLQNDPVTARAWLSHSLSQVMPRVAPPRVVVPYIGAAAQQQIQ